MSSWNNMRKRLEEELLAKSLRGRIRYYCAVYGERPEDGSIAAVRLDGKETLYGKYFEYDGIAVYSEMRLTAKNGGLTRAEVWERTIISVLEKGILDQRMFFSAADRAINSPIGVSLNSENPLVRMFAVLDRRTGKRTLIKLIGRIPREPEWLRQFYFIRLKAENIPLEGQKL